MSISPKHVILYPMHVYFSPFHFIHDPPKFNLYRFKTNFLDLYSVSLPQVSILPSTAKQTSFCFFYRIPQTSAKFHEQEKMSLHPDGEEEKQEANIHHNTTSLAGPSRASSKHVGV
jgi:hypothetical protein